MTRIRWIVTCMAGALLNAPALATPQVGPMPAGPVDGLERRVIDASGPSDAVRRVVRRAAVDDTARPDVGDELPTTPAAAKSLPASQTPGRSSAGMPTCSKLVAVARIAAGVACASSRRCVLDAPKPAPPCAVRH